LIKLRSKELAGDKRRKAIYRVLVWKNKGRKE
jgi:hypothetical protein